jgi:hypothetical protein
MSEVSSGRGLPPVLSEDDLRWWLELAPTLEWIWAKTYAQSAPHDYVVLGRTSGLTREDFVRAGAVIRTFGQPGKFYNSTNVYLTAGGWKWWTMDPRVKDTDLINRATTERSYGRQDAPRTFTGTFTEYDAIAADYDLRGVRTGESLVRARILEFFKDHSPTTLDVGCGTGSLLDLEIVSPRLYTGVDPSQGMLNELVLKHPAVRRLFPARFEDVSDDDLDTPFELVVAMNVPSVDPDRLHALCSGLVIVTEGA